MGFLVPLALAFSALAIPILIFYMLKLRREEQVVSSTMLWRQVLQDREANSLWQRLRRNLLLLLQLLALLLLVIALARPYVLAADAAQGHVVVLLDASASMQATDLTPSRFAVAKERARRLVDSLGQDDAMTIIAVADVPRVLASLTNDRSLLRQALAGVRPGETEADWKSAFVLAASGAQQAADSTVVIVSDGGLPADLPPLPCPVRYVPIGVTAENRAVSALALRDGPDGPQAFVRVSNLGTQPGEVLVRAYADGELLDARRLTLDPDDDEGFSLTDLPLETRLLRVQIDDDALALDNTAWAVRDPGRRAQVLLVTRGNVFLERALELLPNLEPTVMRVGEMSSTVSIAPPAVPPALYIFDGVLPEQLPKAGNLFFIAPPTSTALFRVSGVVTQTGVTRIEADDPLLRYVDLKGLQVSVARAVAPPSWAVSLVEARGGPLLMAGEVGGRRVAILSFDLHRSNLPLLVAFPILMVHLTRWLAPAGDVDLPPLLRPGMPVTIRPRPEATQVIVTAPSGKSWEYQGRSPTSFAHTDELGVYVVEQQGPGVDAESRFAVNLFSEAESRIAPRDSIAIGSTPVTSVNSATGGRREWWRWPALLALGTLIGEWFVHRRGWTFILPADRRRRPGTPARRENRSPARLRRYISRGS